MGHATHRAIAPLPTAPVRADRKGELKETWPLHRRQVLALVIWGVVLTAIFAGIGTVLTGPLGDSRLIAYDEELAERLEAARTPAWNTLSWWGSMLAETAPKIGATILLSWVLLRMWKRWFEPVLMSVALILEASVFLAVTLIVGRPRPSVEHLDGSPIGSSFPSGHTAAAVVYATLAVIVFWHTRNVIARVVVVLVCTAVPIIVGAARMYRGMHHLTDTVAGAVLGLVCLLVTVRVVSSSEKSRAAIDDAVAHRDAGA